MVPGVKKVVSSEVGKTLGKAAVTSVASFGEDLLNGKPAKEAGKHGLSQGIEDLRKSVLKLTQRKSKTNKVRKKKVRRRSTFFDP